MGIKYKIRKNDNVEIVTGKDRGKTGRVIRLDRVKGKVYVEGRNMVKKAMKQRKQNQKGGIMEIEAGIDISNVMVLCKKCGKTRLGIKLEKDKKTRVCKKCGDEI